jgi:hypothetical protein
MKVNCSSIGQLLSTHSYTQMEIVAALRPVLGKSASVTVADAATGADLVAAAVAAFAVDPSAKVTRTALVLKGVEVDASKTLAALGVKDGSAAQIRFVVTI